MMSLDAQPASIAALDLNQALTLATKLHRQGALNDAQALYRRILRIDRRQADATHFLGVLQSQRGRNLRALRLIRRSLRLNGEVAGWHSNEGNLLLEMGRFDEAALAYERSLALDPERPDVYNNLGVLRRAQRRYPEAETAYRRALELSPEFADAYNNYGNLLVDAGRVREALDQYRQALKLLPGHIEARQRLGLSYRLLGMVDSAAQVYREWLAKEPNNALARHYLAACTGQDVPDRASDTYIENTFDCFANGFEAKLASLDYRAPELVAAAVGQVCGAPAKALDILDAGCGTGLCGALLTTYARSLHGVDLSARMLTKAAARGIYHSLVRAELTAFLESAVVRYDLIVSADTLCYFGDLAPVMKAAARALRPGGRFIFTLEASPAQDGQLHRLHPHGRYSHSETYVRQVLTEAGLSIQALASGVLRQENGQPVQGRVVTARRAA
jgi:predicted TPR repeat methyltransferase